MDFKYRIRNGVCFIILDSEVEYNYSFEELKKWLAAAEILDRSDVQHIVLQHKNLETMTPEGLGFSIGLYKIVATHNQKTEHKKTFSLYGQFPAHLQEQLVRLRLHKVLLSQSSLASNPSNNFYPFLK